MNPAEIPRGATPFSRSVPHRYYPERQPDSVESRGAFDERIGIRTREILRKPPSRDTNAQAESSGRDDSGPEVFLGRPSPRFIAAAFIYRAFATPLVAWALLLSPEHIPNLAPILIAVAVSSFANIGLAIAIYRSHLNALLLNPRFYVTDSAIAVSLNLWVAALLEDQTIFLIGRDAFWLYFAGSMAFVLGIVQRRVHAKAMAIAVGGAALLLAMAFINGFSLADLGWGQFVMRIGWLLCIAGLARYLVWVFSEGARVGVRMLTSVQTPSPLRSTFRKEGARWTIAFAEKTSQIEHLVGLDHIHGLLRSPGVEVLALELVKRNSRGFEEQEHAYSSLPEGFVPLELSDTGPVLDRQAKENYRRRVQALQAESQEAESVGDAATVERAALELEFLKQQLSASEDLFRRDRRTSNPREQARVSVSKAIKRAIDIVADWNPDLAKHLNDSIKKGTYCCYRPNEPIHWDL